MSTALGGGWRTHVRQGVAKYRLYYYKPPLVMLAHATARQGRRESTEFTQLNLYSHNRSLNKSLVG